VAIDGQTQLVGIIGWPVAHSLSPAMHNAAFSYTGLNWRYLPLPVRAEQLPDAIRGLNPLGFRGVNITVPHKVDVIPLVDTISEAVTLVGAVNTIRVDLKTGQLEGMNTDMGGFLMDLASNRIKVGKTSRIIVLGAGGSARAVCAGLVRQGASVTIVNRTLANAESLVRYVQSSWTHANIDLAPMDALAAVSSGATLIVNTTPVGQWPGVDQSPWPENVPFPADATVYDLIYRPIKTRLMRDAEAAGLRAVGGIGMLVYQGASAFEAWTGKKAPVDVMKLICLQLLGEAANTPKIEQAD
jgi:shikimate dehydrogenase